MRIFLPRFAAGGVAAPSHFFSAVSRKPHSRQERHPSGSIAFWSALFKGPGTLSHDDCFRRLQTALRKRGRCLGFLRTQELCEASYAERPLRLRFTIVCDVSSPPALCTGTPVSAERRHFVSFFGSNFSSMIFSEFHFFSMIIYDSSFLNIFMFSS